MTPQRAINFLSGYKQSDKCDVPIKNKDLCESLDVALLALKKHLPMKPRHGKYRLKDGGIFMFDVCPACGCVYGQNTMNKYCEACGQRIDQSKE